ncbi:MAG TPA: hypothetical protein VFN48_07475 [Solirubrobacteraceae bacterium]|nr:hypothetical protein [Solirubrobacteraceae bacterium]
MAEAPQTPLKPPSAKEWARADTIIPLPTERLPDEISDGSGLGFPPAALVAEAPALDPEDPAVMMLIQQIDYAAEGPQVRMPWRRETRSAEELSALLVGWRELAATPERRIFGKGVPPRLLTVGVKRERGQRWAITAVSPARQLRASRAGVRASSFRVDPETLPAPGDRRLRLLVTEQTRAGGRLAFGRFQAPDLYLDDEEVLLRCFITPLEGWQAGTRRWETPVVVELPEPLGARRVVDGAIYFAGAPRSAK